jgi:hypothetical protein
LLHCSAVNDDYCGLLLTVIAYCWLLLPIIDCYCLLLWPIINCYCLLL